MAYRSFDTETWKDPWFENLKPEAKLLFIYLWTNDVVNQAGLYRVSRRRIEFECGVDFDATITELEPKVEWHEDQQVVWVKNFCKRQCANPKFLIGAMKSIEHMQAEFKEKFYKYNRILFEKYGSDTVSIPYPDGSDTVSIPLGDGIQTVGLSGTGTVPGTVPGPGVTPPYSPPPTPGGDTCAPNQRKQPSNGRLTPAQLASFEKFWIVYPKRRSKGNAMTAWKKIHPNEQLVATMIAKIEQAKTSENWTKEGGKFIPYPATWLNAMGWEDDYRGTSSMPYSDKTARTIANLKHWMETVDDERQEAVQRIHEHVV